MALLRISEAARVTGVSRVTLHRYIKSGRLTRNPDGTIDTAELQRIGLHLLHDTSPQQSNMQRIVTSVGHVETLQRLLEAVQQHNSMLQRDLEHTKQREERLLTLLEQSYRLLEGRTAPQAPEGHLPVTVPQQPVTLYDTQEGIAQAIAVPPASSQSDAPLTVCPESPGNSAVSKATQDFSAVIPLEMAEEAEALLPSPKSWQTLGPLCKYGHNHQGTGRSLRYYRINKKGETVSDCVVCKERRRKQ